MNITEELCFEAECIATLRGADLLAKSWGEILDFNFLTNALCSVTNGATRSFFARPGPACFKTMW